MVCAGKYRYLMDVKISEGSGNSTGWCSAWKVSGIRGVIHVAYIMCKRGIDAAEIDSERFISVVYYIIMSDVV